MISVAENFWNEAHEVGKEIDGDVKTELLKYLAAGSCFCIGFVYMCLRESLVLFFWFCLICMNKQSSNCS